MAITYWDDEEIALLRDLWKAKVLPDSIAEKLGKIVPDILDKAVELGLSSGGSRTGG
jgi:hypothetical protein